MKAFLTFLFFLLVFGNSGLAMQMDMHMPDSKVLSPINSDRDFARINHRMHTQMGQASSGNVDLDFLKGMIPHHQGAVDMSHVLLKQGRDGRLKSFARKIIRDQEREIASMNRHLERIELLGLTDPAAALTYELFGEVNMKMHKSMSLDFSGNTDIDFVSGMIPHHAGAVDMAKIVIEYGEDPLVRQLAYSVISAQQSEISWMERWLRRVSLRDLFYAN